MSSNELIDFGRDLLAAGLTHARGQVDWQLVAGGLFLLPVALNTNRDNYVLSQGLAAFSVSAGYDVNFGAQFAAFVITVTPVLVVYVIFQRQLQGSVSQGTLK